MGFLVSHDGKVIKAEEARIPANDRFFLYGDGVYEIMGARNETVLDFEPHMDRLRSSAESLDIRVPWSNSEILFEISNLLSSINAPMKSIRFIVSRGQGLSPRLTGLEKPSKYIFCGENHATNDSWASASRLKLQSASKIYLEQRMKTNSYAEEIWAQSKNQAQGFDDICWVSPDGEILECSFSNIFLIARSGDELEICTPPTDRGILPGITRRRIIKLLQNAGIAVMERRIFLEELPRFDEAFTTSSLRGLQPVAAIEGHRLHTCRQNSSARHILRLYQSWIEAESTPNTPSAVH